MKTKSIIHKTCPTWGVTQCNKQLFVQRPPKTSYRWESVTCPVCLELYRAIVRLRKSKRRSKPCANYARRLLR